MSAAVDHYSVPAAPFEAEIKVKGSRFIAHIRPCANRETAETLYAELRKTYYNATHNCFAYRINDREWRYSDDGEPNGTAGKPILQEIEASGLEQTLCVVTRYYGGTKLGTGGLIRAYGEAARLALNGVSRKTLVHAIRFEVRFGYDLESSVRHFINRHKGLIRETDYSNGVRLTVEVPQSLAAAFERQTAEAHQNRVVLLRTET